MAIVDESTRKQVGLQTAVKNDRVSSQLTACACSSHQQHMDSAYRSGCGNCSFGADHACLSGTALPCADALTACVPAQRTSSRQQELPVFSHMRPRRSSPLKTLHLRAINVHCGLTRLQAVQSRLDALENDNADDAPDPFGLAEGDDDEFVMGDSDDDGASPSHMQRTSGMHAYLKSCPAGFGRHSAWPFACAGRRPAHLVQFDWAQLLCWG